MSSRARLGSVGVMPTDGLRIDLVGRTVSLLDDGACSSLLAQRLPRDTVMQLYSESLLRASERRLGRTFQPESIERKLKRDPILWIAVFALTFL